VVEVRQTWRAQEAGDASAGRRPEEIPSDDVAMLDVSDYDPPRLTSKTWRQPQAPMPNRSPFAIHGGQVVGTRGGC
jgi:hypothetical protein